jgi:hypothetical protein
MRFVASLGFDAYCNRCGGVPHGSICTAYSQRAERRSQHQLGQVFVRAHSQATRLVMHLTSARITRVQDAGQPLSVEVRRLGGSR